MAIVKIAWGAVVSATFLDRARWIVDDLDIGYSSDDGLSKLMSCMAWESNETFAPDVKNMAGSGATGLIQFMPRTAIALGTTVDKLAAMTAEDQLNYVWKYFEAYKGKLKTLGDLYMAILWPRGVGKSETYILWDKGSMPKTYRQNAGLDLDNDAVITKAEATAKVAAKLSKGMSAPYVMETLTNPVKHAEPVPDDTPDTVQDELELTDEQVAPDAPETEYVPVDGNAATPKGKVAKVVDELVRLFQKQFTGVLFIAGALLLNPDFATKLGGFTLALARGEGAWGALSALVGAGLLIVARMKDPPASK